MKCYGQLFHPTYVAPTPDDYETFDSLQGAKRYFSSEWEDALQRYSDERPEMLIWRGEPEGEFPCDAPADGQLTFGPRGGIRFTRC